MKKFFKYALLIAAVSTTTVGFTACGSDDDEGTTKPVANVEQEQENALSATINTYLDDVVYPTYGNLATETEKLYDKIASLKSKLKTGTTVAQSDIDDICNTYKTARAYWEESEAFLFGAASDFDIDPHIDTWPLVLPTLAGDLKDNAKIAALDGEDGIEWARSSSNLTPENLGFHGIEFIFFRNGKNRDVTIFNNDAVENDPAFAGLNVTGLEEVIFATAVAGDLRDKCYQLEVSWLGSKAPAAHVNRVKECAASDAEDFKTTVAKNGLSYGDDLLKAGQATSQYSSVRKAIEQIFVGGCSNICAEVADQKMGQAYRAAKGVPETHIDEETGEEVKDDPNYIESPYSYNSYTDFKGNILSIKNTLWGNIGGSTWSNNSIMAYLTKYLPTVANTLNGKLNGALGALDNCLNSGKAFVQDPGAAVVGTAMDKISELDSYLKQVSNMVLHADVE